VLVTGCGLQTATQYTPAASPGSIQPLDGVAGEENVVGSKNFTEQLIRGKIAVIALQVAGFDVVDRTNIPGSVPPARAWSTPRSTWSGSTPAPPGNGGHTCSTNKKGRSRSPGNGP
jgi:hypothetical protein